MRSLNTSTWFENPSLVEITADQEKATSVRLSKFNLNVSQTKKKKPDEEGSGG